MDDGHAAATAVQAGATAVGAAATAAATASNRHPAPAAVPGPEPAPAPGTLQQASQRQQQCTGAQAGHGSPAARPTGLPCQRPRQRPAASVASAPAARGLSPKRPHHQRRASAHAARPIGEGRAQAAAVDMLHHPHAAAGAAGWPVAGRPLPAAASGDWQPDSGVMSEGAEQNNSSSMSEEGSGD